MGCLKHYAKSIAATGLMICALATPSSSAQTTPPNPAIVAAENFYGDIARQIAGPNADVTSILANPDEDPHLFEASPSVARAISAARIVIANGADYDPWMNKLLAAAKSPTRQTIIVADLVGAKPGDNPHLWYNVETISLAAKSIAAALDAADPSHAADTSQRLQDFTRSLQPLRARIAAMRQLFAGISVTATEPVFAPMAAALGLVMRNQRFQLAVMNDTEPSASDIAAFEADLRGHRVRALLFNSQATNTAARRLLDITKQARIPVVGVTETEPAGKTYQTWMLDQLDALNAALSRPPP